MQEFVNAILAAERKLTAATEAKKPPLEAKAEWCEAVWRARNWLPADPNAIPEKAHDYLAEIEKKRLEKIKPIPTVPDAQKSPERKAMEAAGFVGAKGPDAYSIAVCRQEGELLRPLAHYWHGRQWWNLVRPPAGTKTKQGRGMADLLKTLRDQEENKRAH